MSKIMHYLGVICGHKISNNSFTRNIDSEKSDGGDVDKF